jgi:uncharacterized protein with PQ loop repeat
MSMIALGRYLKEHWRGFLLAATLGVTVPLIGSSWVWDQAWLRAVLRLRDVRVLSGVALACIVILSVAWLYAVHFWRRYRQTQALTHPPLQYVDFIVVGLGGALLTVFILFRPSLFQLWELGTSKVMRIFLIVLSSAGGLWLFSSWVCSRRHELSKTTPITNIRKPDSSPPYLTNSSFLKGSYSRPSSKAHPEPVPVCARVISHWRLVLGH